MCPVNGPKKKVKKKLPESTIWGFTRGMKFPLILKD